MVPTIVQATDIAVKVHNSGVVEGTTDHTVRAGGPLNIEKLVLNRIPLCVTEGKQLQNLHH